MPFELLLLVLLCCYSSTTLWKRGFITFVDAGISSGGVDEEKRQQLVGEPLDVKSPSAVKAAEFAVRELSQLSDSNIYTTLSLSRILSASYQDGIYHYNTIMTLELASDFFKSGSRVETFDFVVMTHKEDGTSSIAIDEFPVMDDDAIEEFYIKKIESKRAAREASFRRMEVEAYLLNEQKYASRGEMSMLSTEELLEEVERRKQEEEGRGRGGGVGIDGIGESSNAGSTSSVRNRYMEEEKALLGMSASELYEIVLGKKIPAVSDYTMHRAQQLIDELLL